MEGRKRGKQEKDFEFLVLNLTLFFTGYRLSDNWHLKLDNATAICSLLSAHLTLNYL